MQICRYGFVVYADPAVTDIACQGLNGLKMGDRVLTVRRATEVLQIFHHSHYCATTHYAGGKHLWSNKDDSQHSLHSAKFARGASIL